MPEKITKVIVLTSFTHRGESFQGFETFDAEEWQGCANMLNWHFENKVPIEFSHELAKHDHAYFKLDQEGFTEMFKVKPMSQDDYEFVELFVGTSTGIPLAGAMWDAIQYSYTPEEEE